MHLTIGNKLYSSWSLRPWIMMKALGVPFSEEIIPLRQPDTATRLAKASPSGKVPVLNDEGVVVWESLAILEYLHEKVPDAGVWPKERAARAHARAIAGEMHAGFQPLRAACPMNLLKHFRYKTYGADVMASVARVEAVWAQARQRFGAGGPFLYGAFSAADAMYAPVVTRLDTYNWPVTPQSRAYMDAVLSCPPFLAWKADALAESWRIEAYEDGHTPV